MICRPAGLLPPGDKLQAAINREFGLSTAAIEASFFTMTLGNRLCASFVLAIEAECQLVGISEQLALYAFVPAKMYEPAFLQKLKQCILQRLLI